MTATVQDPRTGDHSVSPERLRQFLTPRSIAVIGANERSAWSQYTVGNLRSGGFTGDIHLVSRRGGEAHGLPIHSSISELPRDVDLAVVITGTSTIEPLLDECHAHGIRNLVVLAAGFSETGEEGQLLQKSMVERARRNDQLILGPNNLGFVNAHAGVAAFAQMIEANPLYPGGVGVASQSGALCIFLLPYMATRGVGTSLTVSVGNEAMISVTDVMSLMVEDEDTKVIAAYMEQIGDPEAFVDVARRALAKRKPIVLFKTGRGEVAARVASAHTGSLVGDDAVIDAVCTQYGVIRVDSIEEMVATAGILERTGVIEGNRLGVVNGSGAMCALIAERAEALGIDLPVPSPATIERLRDEGMPEFATINNPMDVTGYVAIDPSIMSKAQRAFADDPQFDVLLVQGTVANSEPAAQFMGPMVGDLIELTRSSRIPVLPMAFLPQEITPFGRQWMAEVGYPHCSDSFDRGLAGLARALDWSERVRQLDGLPAPVPVTPIEPPADAATWTEIETAQLLRDHGIPVVPATLATDADAAVAAADELGYPVVLKVVSPDIEHKTEAGGVRLDLRDADAVRAAFAAISASVAAAAPEAEVRGVAVSPMRAEGQELIVGIVRDPQWGLVLAVGLGGVFVELLQDTALRVLPVCLGEIRQMLESLKGIETLKGFRGSEPVDLDVVADVVYLVAHLAQGLDGRIDALEVNPLRVSGDQVEALDVLVNWRSEDGASA